MCVGWDLPRVFREWYGMIPGLVPYGIWLGLG